MKFIELHIENFCTIDEVTLPLADQGLVLVLGQNKDSTRASSNGAGKSLLLDSLCWCLWGTTVRGLSGDQVMNRWKKKDCYVSVDFEEGNTKYRVERYRGSTKHTKPDDLVLWVNGSPEGSGASMKATQDRVNAILGLDFTTFSLMMPGSGVKAAELTDAKIKEHLEKIMQTEVLTQAQDLAKAKAKAIQGELASLQQKKQWDEKQLTEEESRLAKLQERSSQYAQNREANMQRMRDTIESLTKKARELDNLLLSRPAIETKLQSAKELYAELQEDLHKLEKEEKAATSFHHREELLLNSLLQETRAELLQVNKKRELLSRDVCISCSQEITEGHKADQHAVLSAAEADFTLELEKRQKELKERQNARVQEVLSFDSRKNCLRGDMQNIQKDIQKYVGVLGQMDVAASQSKSHWIRVDELTVELEEAEMKEDFSPAIQMYVEKIGDLKLSLGDLEEEIADKEKELAKYTFWVNGFSTKGIRSYMLKHITPILNDRAKHYADLLTGGEMTVTFHTERELKKGATKEEFHIEVLHSDGSNSYEGSSKGERARADLIIAFALGDLAGLRANKVIPFRFLDEPFESVDDVGTEFIVRLLNEQKDKYETVFVVTHEDYFKQLFSKRITMVKHNRKSRMEVDDC